MRKGVVSKKMLLSIGASIILMGLAYAVISQEVDKIVFQTLQTALN